MLQILSRYLICQKVQGWNQIQNEFTLFLFGNELLIAISRLEITNQKQIADYTSSFISKTPDDNFRNLNVNPNSQI